MKKALLIAAFVLSASPASAATIVVTDSPITGDVAISTSESNNSRTNNQSQQAEISNNQNQETNQEAEGGDQNTHHAILPINLAPALNVAVPVQVPVEILTTKTINQNQNYEDRSNYETAETTQIDNSRGKITLHSIPLDRPVFKDTVQTIALPRRFIVDGKVNYSGETLPVTGVDVGRTLLVALTLITTGFGLTKFGRISEE